MKKKVFISGPILGMEKQSRTTDKKSLKSLSKPGLMLLIRGIEKKSSIMAMNDAGGIKFRHLISFKET